MTATTNDLVGTPAQGDIVSAETGEILGKFKFEPAVLPMAGLVMADLLELQGIIGVPVVFVYALTNKGGLKRGDVYRLKALTAKGQLVVEGNPYAFKMDDFCMAVPVLTAANDNTKKVAKK